MHLARSVLVKYIAQSLNTESPPDYVPSRSPSFLFSAGREFNVSTIKHPKKIQRQIEHRRGMPLTCLHRTMNFALLSLLVFYDFSMHLIEELITVKFQDSFIEKSEPCLRLCNVHPSV